MELYFSPLACSTAPRIVADEQGITLTTVEVDLRLGRTQHGEDYAAINPLRQVPALKLDDGEVLVENVAILDYLSGLGLSELTPSDPLDRTRILRWLCFINAELHAIVFHYLLSDVPDAVKLTAMRQAEPRFNLLEKRLAERDHLVDRFTAADAYLFIVLSWAGSTSLKLDRWPPLAHYRARLADRPSIARAMAIELPLYRARR